MIIAAASLPLSFVTQAATDVGQRPRSLTLAPPASAPDWMARESNTLKSVPRLSRIGLIEPF